MFLVRPNHAGRAGCCEAPAWVTIARSLPGLADCGLRARTRNAAVVMAVEPGGVASSCSVSVLNVFISPDTLSSVRFFDLLFVTGPVGFNSQESSKTRKVRQRNTRSTKQESGHRRDTGNFFLYNRQQQSNNSHATTVNMQCWHTSDADCPR